MKEVKYIALIALLLTILSSTLSEKPKLVVVTIATEQTDGLKRLQRSAGAFGIELHVFGEGETWYGGDTRIEQGGGQKVRILRKSLEMYKEANDVIILFVDAYDVIFNANSDQILERFLDYFADYRVVFSAEPFCWPQKELSSQYPLVNFGYRYLNSGIFMGYAPEIWQIINSASIEDGDDDQLFYTLVYLKDDLRNSLKITLDSLALLFMNLNGAYQDISLEFDKQGEAVIYNHIFNTHPFIIHGNGPSKYSLNHIGNYIGKMWSSQTGFALAEIGEDKKLMNRNQKLWPTITLAVFIPKPIPFIREFFALVQQIDYPRSLIDIYIYNNQEYNRLDVDEFVRQVKHLYHEIKVDNMLDVEERQARTHSLGIIAPMVRQKNKPFSNFWGALSENGYYSRSEDYLKIVSSERQGVWNVPYISSIILIRRDKGHFLNVDNQVYHGYLVNTDDFDASKLHPEIYQIFDNRELWETRYIHEKYHEALSDGKNIEEPCPDVYEFPFLSDLFCLELIEEMEKYGEWSSGSHSDNRIAGGYENVPTRDIHMKQIDFERHWLYILDEYVRPIQERIFTGYFHQPIESHMMFVVRYRADEQASLRPHHDASTYSIDVALNKKGVSFKGGGVRFVRYNCTVDADHVGYSMIFPGRLTHLHEGLPTTEGTRYILVSFINP